MPGLMSKKTLGELTVFAPLREGISNLYRDQSRRGEGASVHLNCPQPSTRHAF